MNAIDEEYILVNEIRYSKLSSIREKGNES